jgi:hypothetical protein
MKQEVYEALCSFDERGMTIDGLEHFRAAMRRFPHGRGVITVKVLRESRSSQQNRFYHGVIIPLFAEHCGYEFDEMKDALALKLIPREVVDLDTGEVRIVPGHTSQLNTKEFNDLIERAQRLGAEMGIDIPNTGEVSRVA